MNIMHPPSARGVYLFTDTFPLIPGTSHNNYPSFTGISAIRSLPNLSIYNIFISALEVSSLPAKNVQKKEDQFNFWGKTCTVLGEMWWEFQGYSFIPTLTPLPFPYLFESVCFLHSTWKPVSGAIRIWNEYPLDKILLRPCMSSILSLCPSIALIYVHKETIMFLFKNKHGLPLVRCPSTKHNSEISDFMTVINTFCRSPLIN